MLSESQQWYLNGNPIPNATGVVFEPLIEGIYHIEATYYGNCQVSSSTMVFRGTGIEEGEQNFAAIYPNPSNGRFHVQFACAPTADAQLLLTDVVGREVLRETNISSGLVTIKSEVLKPGVFLIFLKENKQWQYLGKVILLNQ